MKHNYFTDVSYFLTQSHNTLTQLSQLGKVFTTVMAENRILHSPCCTIGDLASDVSLAQK
jgi:regulator of replication initiation timing